MTNREIGERLHLSEKTIKHYITNILEKLHVRSRVEAAMLAVRGARRDEGLVGLTCLRKYQELRARSATLATLTWPVDSRTRTQGFL